MATATSTERGGALRTIEAKMTPKEALTVDQIAARTGLDRTVVANAINPRIAKKNGWTRVKRGTYKFLGYGGASTKGASKVKVAGTRKTTKRATTKRAAAPTRAQVTVAALNGSGTMKMIGTALDGTPLLRDGDGALYKAVPLA